MKMNIREVGRKHKGKILVVGGTLLAVAASVALYKLGAKTRSKQLISDIVIDPDYYDTLEEAIEAFKELGTKVDYPVLCGNGIITKFGVFDETPVISPH